MTGSVKEGKDAGVQGEKKKMTGLSPEKKYACMTLLIMTFIFIQSAFPGDLSGRESGFIARFVAVLFQGDLEEVSFFVRKGAHFTEYLLLGISLFLWIRERGRSGKNLPDRVFGRPGWTSLAAWTAGTVYALTDEIHQLFVADRSGQIRDVVIDSAGVLAGILLTKLLHHYIHKGVHDI